MRIAKTISQLLVTILGVALCSAAMLVLTAQHATVDSVRAVDAVAYRGMFNPGATLDTTQIDDIRDDAPVASTLDYATESVLIVDGQNPDTTPVVKVTFPNGAQIWIPEEDPNGGHPTQARMWLDNSPLYSGGWLLQVNDETGSVKWVDVQERLSLTDKR